MIIWIASYPKSGNTYLRSFLASYYSSKKGKFDFKLLMNIPQFPSIRFSQKDFLSFNDAAKNWIPNQNFFFKNTELFYLKTHNSLNNFNDIEFTTNNETLGAIYIVRDPRNVITSLKNYFNFDNYDDALEFILDDRKVIGIKNSKKEMDLPHIISSWKNHFNSWKKMNKNYLLIKYENLITSPEVELQKILNYLEKLLNIKFDKLKILDAIEKSSFANLKRKEQDHGFIEAPTSSFFNLGPKNDWRKLLSEKISEKIEKEFKAEMMELNYL